MPGRGKQAITNERKVFVPRYAGVVVGEDDEGVKCILEVADVGDVLESELVLGEAVGLEVGLADVEAEEVAAGEGGVAGGVAAV